MKFEKMSSSSEFDCEVAFDTDEEAEVITAVYREHVVNLAKTGNLGSIHSFDIAMSNYADQKDYPYKRFRSAEQLINMVQAFHDNTETAVMEIAHESNQPALCNNDIGVRMELGEAALDLVEKLQEETEIGDTVRAFRELPETNPDRDISGL